METPDEQNPSELLKRIQSLESRLVIEEDRSKELEAGITRMAGYLGVVHVLKGA